jgi:hypothetical protein
MAAHLCSRFQTRQLVESTFNGGRSLVCPEEMANSRARAAEARSRVIALRPLCQCPIGEALVIAPESHIDIQGFVIADQSQRSNVNK